MAYDAVCLYEVDPSIFCPVKNCAVQYSAHTRWPVTGSVQCVLFIEYFEMGDRISENMHSSHIQFFKV